MPDILPRSQVLLLLAAFAILVSTTALLPNAHLASAHAGTHLALSSQTVSPEDSVRATIRALFDGMRAGDSTAVRRAFHPDARLMTATAEGVRLTDIARFADVVGSPREDVWDERTYDVQVEVDGPMAAAWVPYAFYRGDTFSHCGVNAVQFARDGGVWRILHLIDTRRSECDLPASVKGGKSSE
jgi:hypothetical protein